MFDLRRLLRRSTMLAEDPHTEFNSTVRGSGALAIEREIEELTWSQLERAGVSSKTIQLEVRSVSSQADEKQMYVAMARIIAWDRKSVVRVLLGLPLLEAKTRRLFQASWLSDVAGFGGIWLHASQQLQASAALGELRNLVLRLEDAGESDGALSDAIWSVPPHPLEEAFTSAK